MLFLRAMSSCWLPSLSYDSIRVISNEIGSIDSLKADSVHIGTVYFELVATLWESMLLSRLSTPD